MKDKLKDILSFIKKCVIVYLFILVGMFVFQRQIMYNPLNGTPGTPVQWGLGQQTQVIETTTSDGLKVTHWYRPAASEDKPVFVFFHGNANHIGGISKKARHFMRRGWGALLVEYRGYAGNPGHPTEEGLYNDGRAALNWLRDEAGVPSDRWVLYGESLGSGVAVQMGVEYDPLKAVVLEAPLTSAVDIAFSRYPFLPVNYLLKDRYENEKKIKDINTPLLIVHGTKDRIVPIRFGYRVYDAAKKPKFIIRVEEGRHNSLYDYNVAPHIADFITKYVDVKHAGQPEDP